MTNRGRVIAAALAVLALTVIGVEVASRSGGPGEPSGGFSRNPAAVAPPGPQRPASAEGSTVAGLPVPAKVVALQPPPAKLDPAFWLDVLQPKAVHEAVAGNAWLKDTSTKPVGRGFLGPWSVFFGTRGKDIGARFDGLVLDLFTGAMLAQPYRVVWLTGEKSARAPVLVVPDASPEALSTLDTLVAAAGKGGFSPQGCPGDAPKEAANPEERAEANEGANADAGTPAPAAGLGTIHRLVLADHALFAAAAGKRLIISMRPDAVLHGMCLKPFELKQSGNAVELGVSLSENGRALQGLAAMLGLEPEARLALGVEGDGFAPRGIVAGLAHPSRLVAGPLDPSMLKLVPANTGTFVALNVSLPETLDQDALRAAFAGKPSTGKAVKRQVLVLWDPRGDFHARSEVAVIWSRAEDEPFLTSALSAKHPLEEKKLCGHVVLASTEPLLKAIEASCAGSSPSVLSAAPAVAQGLQAPTSLGLHVNLGEVLSQLALDGWLTEPGTLPDATAAPKKSVVPPEIDAARKQLEALPVLHWRAVVDEKGQLTPGGFRS